MVNLSKVDSKGLLLFNLKKKKRQQTYLEKVKNLFQEISHYLSDLEENLTE